MMPLLEARDVTTWFPIKRGILARTVGYVRAVDGVSLQIHAGETVGLVGESGCGKTTFGRTVLGLERPRSGELRFRGEPLWQGRCRHLLPLRRRIQMIFQDPYSSLNPRMTVVEIVTEGLLEHGLITPRQRVEAAVRWLGEVGMDASALHRYPHEFSGGQRQRISIARAVALQPDLVICDEAVSALDVSVRAQVLNLLMELRARHNLAYLFISHDLSVVRHITQRVGVMYLGIMVETGPTALILDRPLHPYTRALTSAVPVPFAQRRSRLVLPGDVPSAAHPPAGCRFHTRCPFAVPACRQTVPRLEPAGDGRMVACLRKAELPPTDTAG